jgi:hypothetical protein
MFKAIQERNGRFPVSEPELPLKGGSGNGTSGGMDGWQTSVEKRLDSLDGRMKNVEAGVSDLRVDVATIKETVRHLPTKPWMFSTLAAMLTALGVIVALIVRFVPPAA